VSGLGEDPFFRHFVLHFVCYFYVFRTKNYSNLFSYLISGPQLDKHEFQSRLLLCFRENENESQFFFSFLC
jgi:hypothetical protein